MLLGLFIDLEICHYEGQLCGQQVKVLLATEPSHPEFNPLGSLGIRITDFLKLSLALHTSTVRGTLMHTQIKTKMLYDVCLYSVEPGHAHKLFSGFHHLCTLSKPDPLGTDITLTALAKEKLLVARKVTDATGRQTLDCPLENIAPLAATGKPDDQYKPTHPPAGCLLPTSVTVLIVGPTCSAGSHTLCYPKDVY